MSVALKVETRAVADQHSAGTSIRILRLADGTIVEHEVGPLAWVDVLRYRRMAQESRGS